MAKAIGTQARPGYIRTVADRAITSRVSNYPTGVVLPPGLIVAGKVLLSHIRGIDTVARPVTYAGGTVPRWVADDVRKKLDAMIRV